MPRNVVPLREKGASCERAPWERGLHTLHEPLSDFEYLAGLVVWREAGLVGRAFGSVGEGCFRHPLHDFQLFAVSPIGHAVPNATEVLVVGGAECVEPGVFPLLFPRMGVLELLVVDIRY